MKTLMALAVGLMSLVVTVAIVVGIEQLTDFSLFTLTFWFIVPVGAFLVGLLPALAFYFAADKLNLKATKVTGAVMFVLAAGVQWGIYFARWKMVSIPPTDGIPAGSHFSDFIGFGEFVQIMLTNAQYQVGHSDSTAFTVGAFGYLIALIQFAAVATAGFAAYFALAGRPFCEECQTYADEKRKLIFAFQAPGGEVRATMHAHQIASIDYLVAVHTIPAGGDSGLELRLMRCRGACQRDLVQELPVARNKNGQWVVSQKGSRVLWAAPGSRLDDTFQSLQVRAATVGVRG